jgi:hypothetical protein
MFLWNQSISVEINGENLFYSAAQQIKVEAEGEVMMPRRCKREVIALCSLCPHTNY